MIYYPGTLYLRKQYDTVVRDDFFQLFNWFQLFSSEKNSECFRIQLEQIKKIRQFWKGCVEGFSYFLFFFIDFQLFYFLTRIIPNYSIIICSTLHLGEFKINQWNCHWQNRASRLLTNTKGKVRGNGQVHYDRIKGLI
jgi:hypothetical protein